MKLRLLLIALILAMAGAGLAFPNTTAQGSYSFQVLRDAITSLSWGGEHHRVEIGTPSGKVILHYVRFSTRTVEPAVVLADGKFGAISTIEEMVRGQGAVAGINANFYDPNTNLPIGFLLNSSSILNGPYSDRATLSVEFFGRMRLSNPKVTPYIKTASGDLPLQGVNRWILDNSLLLYTPEFGRPKAVPADAKIFAIQGGRVIWLGTGRLPGYIQNQDVSWLIATGSAKRSTEKISLAERLSISYTMTPPIFFVKDAVQAGPMLLRAGKITLLRPEGFKPEFIRMKAARSALGLTATGDVVLLVVTKGNGSAGMGLDDVAEYLRSLGVADAMAMDGGGSSSLVFQQGERLRNVGGTREVPVGLVFLPR